MVEFFDIVYYNIALGIGVGLGSLAALNRHAYVTELAKLNKANRTRNKPSFIVRELNRQANDYVSEHPDAALAYTLTKVGRRLADYEFLFLSHFRR